MMSELSTDARRRTLLRAVGQLAMARSFDDLISALRGSARVIGAADGITVVRRLGDRVAYVAEDAVSPLWTGQEFPIETCISGIAMLENEAVLIPDITADPRVPLAAYARTFVRSMAMFPIGSGAPTMAMGAYWKTAGPLDPESVALLASLAHAADDAFQTVARHERIATPPRAA